MKLFEIPLVTGHGQHGHDGTSAGNDSRPHSDASEKHDRLRCTMFLRECHLSACPFVEVMSRCLVQWLDIVSLLQEF